MSHRLNTLVQEARYAVFESPERLVSLFDSLKPKQKISVAMTSVMGRGIYTDGHPHDWLVGRRGKSAKYGTETITLIPADDPTRKFSVHNAFRLWKRKDSDGDLFVTASHGDMGLSLKSINGIPTK